MNDETEPVRRTAGGKAASTPRYHADVQTYPVTACPGCGSATSVEIAFGGTGLRRCADCALTHAPEMADPADVYVDGYLTADTPFGTPDATDPAFQRYLEFCAHRRLDVIERWIGQAGPLLDVGCGTGDVLVAAAARGVEAVGVEPVADSVRIASARGVNAHHALLEDAGLPESTYRTVTAFHVLEHMADGLAFLRLITRWARPGGHVLVEVPNWRSVDRRTKGSDWPSLRPLEHLAHYSPATLKGTFERSGLTDVRVRTLTFQSPEQSLRFALADLGLRRVYRSRIGRFLGVDHTGDGVIHPRRTTWWALRGAARVYDVAKVGQVVLAVGRRPVR